MTNNELMRFVLRDKYFSICCKFEAGVFVLLPIIIFLFSNPCFSEVPAKFKYQALLRDADGTILNNKATTVQVDILAGSVTGNSAFRETYQVTTSPTGIINLNIGDVNANGLLKLRWDSISYFIKLTVDNVEMGVTQILGVPYALQANSVSNENQKLSISSDSTKLSISGSGGNSLDISNWNTNRSNTVFLNKINPNWSGWSESRLTYGIDKSVVPVPVKLNSQLIVPGTVIAGGTATSAMRWGLHVFEGYASDNISRITMLVNKHSEESRNVAEMYYYKMGYGHGDNAYQWLRIGSDVRQHSFMFSRDKAVYYGALDLRSIISLARVNPAIDLNSTYSTIADVEAKFEPESNYAEHAKCLLYISLKNSQNGTMFYDTVRNKIVAKVNGKWQDVVTQEIPNGTYNF